MSPKTTKSNIVSYSAECWVENTTTPSEGCSCESDAILQKKQESTIYHSPVPGPVAQLDACLTDIQEVAG